MCPDCPPAREARQLVLDSDFLANLLIAIAPFAIALLIAAAIMFCLDRSGRC
jgi:hypothetical protein